MDPLVLSPEDRIEKIDELKLTTGFSTVPITMNGKVGGKLVGIVTSRDVDFIPDRSKKLSEVMTTNLVVGNEPITLREAHEKLRTSKKGKLPIVNDSNELVALTTRQDLKQSRDFATASMDPNKQLLCGASISTAKGSEVRAQKLVEAGVDVIVIDSSLHGARQIRIYPTYFLVATCNIRIQARAPCESFLVPYSSARTERSARCRGVLPGRIDSAVSLFLCYDDVFFFFSAHCIFFRRQRRGSRMLPLRET